MRIRYYIDPDTQKPHVQRHGVREDEIEDVLGNSGEDRRGRNGARVAIGQTRAGRYLRMIYVPDPQRESAFVITAYDLKGKALKAYRARNRGRR